MRKTDRRENRNLLESRSNETTGRYDSTHFVPSTTLPPARSNGPGISPFFATNDRCPSIQSMDGVISGIESTANVPVLGKRAGDRRSLFTHSSRISGRTRRTASGIEATQTFLPSSFVEVQPASATPPLITGFSPGAAAYTVGDDAVPPSSAPRPRGAFNRYLPPCRRTNTVSVRDGWAARSARTASRARPTVLNGNETLPILRSLPPGETWNVVCRV